MNKIGINTTKDSRRGLMNLSALVDEAVRWRFVPYRGVVDAVVTSSTFAVWDPTWWIPGMPLKWMTTGTTYYGIVHSVSGRIVTVRGASLSTTDPIDAMWLGHPELVVHKRMFYDGNFAAAPTGDKNLGLAHDICWWDGPPAYLVRVRAFCHTGSGDASPGTGNILISTGPRYLFSAAFNLPYTTLGGGTIATAVNASTYRVVDQEYTHLDLIAAEPGPGSSSDLTLSLTFVLE